MAKRKPSPLFSLPLLTEEEVDALLIGLCQIELDEESHLASAAEALIQRLTALLPEPGAASKSKRTSRTSASSNGLAAEVHAAVLNEHSLRIAYSDRKGTDTRRTIWPIEFYSSGYEDGTVLAWCETREDFRNFRTDRIRSMETLERYPVRRQLLLARWAAQHVDDFY
jgi:predicted DNA-binding transcriptional regulator YafY